MNNQTKYYTPQGEHPEDRISRDKEYINRLQKHINNVFDTLCKDLRMESDGEDVLFDYIFNCDEEDMEFTDYIDRIGYDYGDLVKEEYRP